MIDEETKNNLLEELEKSGNVYLACLKIGIHRSIYYRWKKDDKEFRKKATQAEKRGRESNCDIAEHALMLNVKEKKMEAIKYVLSHNSLHYKPSHTSNVIFVHKKEGQIASLPQKTLEDLLDENEEIFKENIDRIKRKYEKLGGIPLKTDGTIIKDDELPNYEMYIEEYYKKIES